MEACVYEHVFYDCTIWGAMLHGGDGGRPAGVCRAPPRVPTRDTPTAILETGGTPVGNAGPARGPQQGTIPRLAKSSTALHFPIPAPSGFRPSPEWRIGGRIDDGMPRITNYRPPKRSIFIAMTESVAVVYPG